MQAVEDESSLTVSRHRPIRDQVADNLRSAIVNMRFTPGQRLVEQELCELTGASRASLRQALRVLEAEGLIETKNGLGTTVAVPTRDQIKELYVVRSHLEGLAVRLATEQAGTETDRRLTACLAAMEGALRADELNTTLLKAKDDFYRIVFETIRNTTLEQYLGMIHRRIPQMRATSIRREGRGAQAYAEMCEVVDSMLARDSARAEHFITLHVDNAGRAALGDVP
ncbi:hypothetical protein CH295_25915 [Rhodococcus sp. 14-2483-1-2]|nr:hypothetical protein CH295_25915 [Rhodococcus sp. 14-2483-1-2]